MLFQKQQLDPCITESKWKRFFCQGFSKRQTNTALCSEFNAGPQMSVYETRLFAILVSFSQPILDRKLCQMYFDCSNLYLLAGHIFNTMNLNINGTKKCGEAIKGPFEEHQGTVKGPFASALCSQPCLTGTQGSDAVTLPRGSRFGLQC